MDGGSTNFDGLMDEKDEDSLHGLKDWEVLKPG
jgi:hypothetical protein